MSAQTTKAKKISIKSADKAFYQRESNKNRLIGNVVFEHEGALLYCDSAWLYAKDNRLEAFRNVRINQGDTLFLIGDYLIYSGTSKKATVTGEIVELKDAQMTLTTTQLFLDRTTNESYYLKNGTILSADNVLSSKQGFYNTRYKTFNFKDSVILVNPRYNIESDTLLYDSNTKFARFKGPTDIYSDSSRIYTEKGYYDTGRDKAYFNEGTYIYVEDRYLTGDSIYYEKNNDFGEVFGCLYLHDTLDNYMLEGDYGQYIGASDSAFVTINALYSVVENEDTIYMHGDTLVSYQEKYKNSIHRKLEIYRGVKFYKSDLQGNCDSLSYSGLDSTFKMFYSPIIWNDSSQVSGDTIFLTMRNNTADSLKIYHDAFIISADTLSRFNQIKGRNMKGKFRDNALRKVYVYGNGQTLYYLKDESNAYIGMNASICSNIIIYLKDNTVDKTVFLVKPEEVLYPMDQIEPGTEELKGFFPRFKIRPRSKDDLFK